LIASWAIARPYGIFEQLLWGEPVGHHHVGVGQKTAAPDRDEFRVAWSAADQCNGALGHAGCLRGVDCNEAQLQGFPDGGADARGAAMLAPGQHADR
jgi:hypothetical protein